MFSKKFHLLIIICQILANKFTSTLASGSADNSLGLPDGYIPFPEYHSAYKVYEMPASWKDARELCTLDGANLAIIDTGEKLKKINQMKTIVHVWLHVGFYRLRDSEFWLRVDNGEVAQWLPWATGQPDAGGHCAGIDGDEDNFGRDMGLVDYDCDRPGDHYVCEIRYD